MMPCLVAISQCTLEPEAPIIISKKKMLQLVLEPLGKLKKTTTSFIYHLISSKNIRCPSTERYVGSRSLRPRSRVENCHLLKRTILIQTRYLVSSSDPLLKMTSFSFQLCSPPSKSYLHFKKSITTYWKYQGKSENQRERYIFIPFLARPII